MGRINDPAGLRGFFGLPPKVPDLGPNDREFPVIGAPQPKPKPPKPDKPYIRAPDDEPIRDHVCPECGEKWYGTMGLYELRVGKSYCQRCWLEWYKAELPIKCHRAEHSTVAAQKGGSRLLGYINNKKSILEI